MGLAILTADVDHLRPTAEVPHDSSCAEEEVMAGTPCSRWLRSGSDSLRSSRLLVQDGGRSPRAMPVAYIAGPMRAMLAMERTALNFLQRLSGIATMTARFVAEVADTSALILDTRQDHAGLAGLGEIRGPLRRGPQPSHWASTTRS